MLTKKKVVAVHKNYCKVLINPSDEVVQSFNDRGMLTYENPDLSRVINYPPEYWKVIDGEFHPCSLDEMVQRKDLLSIKEVFEVKKDEPQVEEYKVHKFIYIAASVVIGFILYKILKG